MAPIVGRIVIKVIGQAALFAAGIVAEKLARKAYNHYNKPPPPPPAPGSGDKPPSPT